MKKLLTEKKKKSIIVYLILWLLLAIVFVLPAAVAKGKSTNPLTKETVPGSFFEIVGNEVLNVNSRFEAFNSENMEYTKSFMGSYTLIYAGAMLILILKSKDKGNYRDIEHGSSDWSEGGEQYKVLNKREGIILAENNYLPVDKPGNVNVLIVGRIR